MSDMRFDNRSQAEFAKDIKKSHQKELEIAVRLGIAEHHKTKIYPQITTNGVDMSGDFIEKTHKVTSAPDFKIGDRLVEITRSDFECKRTFHQKCNKINRMMEEDFDLVFINGLLQFKQPNYIRLTSEELRPFLQKSITKYGEVLHPGTGKGPVTSKKAFRWDIFWFSDLWRPLPVLIKDLPKEYLDLLKLAN